MTFDDSWEKAAGIRTKALLTLPLTHSGHLLGVLQLVNKKGMASFTIKDEKNGFPITQALALAIYNHKKNASAVADSKVEAGQSSSNGDNLSQRSLASVDGKYSEGSANILIQREEDETTILVRVLKDGSRLVYQQINPPRDVIKLIKEVANIDLDLSPNPHRRKGDAEI
jgi:hypothetical protein